MITININDIWVWIAGFAGGVALLVNLFKNLKEIKKAVSQPKEDMEKRLKGIEQGLLTLADDNKKIDELREDQKMIADCMYQVLDHMATNNNTGGMKKALDKYNKYYRNKEED